MEVTTLAGSTYLLWLVMVPSIGNKTTIVGYRTTRVDLWDSYKVRPRGAWCCCRKAADGRRPGYGTDQHVMQQTFRKLKSCKKMK